MRIPIGFFAAPAGGPPPPVGFRYFGFKMTRPSPNLSAAVYKLAVITPEGDYPPENLTAADAPAPYVVTSSPPFNASFPAWHAFDGNAGTLFLSYDGSTNDAWIIIDMGSVINALGFKYKSGAAASPDGPGAISFRGSVEAPASIDDMEEILATGPLSNSDSEQSFLV